MFPVTQHHRRNTGPTHHEQRATILLHPDLTEQDVFDLPSRSDNAKVYTLVQTYVVHLRGHHQGFLDTAW
jgi:hypothetical protein